MADAAPDSRLSELAIDRSRRRRPGRRARWLVLGPIALALAALALIALSTRPRTIEVTQVRQAAPGETDTALTASGYVAADRRSVVAPKYAGRLEKVEVDEGDRVAEGEVIARLDPLDAQIAEREAQAAVGAARATLAAEQAQAIQAERALARARKLARGGAITGEAMLDAKAARDTARAQQNAGAARLEEAQRALDAAEQRLDDTVIRAPFDGTVARKLADEGAVLAPAAITEPNVGGIVELVDLSSLYVQAEVSEEQLGRIHVGEPALVFLDALPARVFRARAGSVRPLIDKAKGTATVRVEFDQIPEGPLPAMSARVSFLTREVSEGELASEPRLRVPAPAVVERGGQSVVLAVRDGRAEVVPVQVAGRAGSEAVLRQGPAPGTPVVAAPGPHLRSGSRVKVRAKAS
jgi:HlyD family secretion protein